MRNFLIVVLFFSMGTVAVYSAMLNSLSNIMSSVKINNVSNHYITFVTPSGVAGGETLQLVFPGSFSIPSGLSYTDVDVLDNGNQLPLLASPSGASLGVVRTNSTTLIITNGTTPIAAGDTIRIIIGTNATSSSFGVQQITNDTTPGSKVIGISGTFGDVGSTTVFLLSDDSVAISATVEQAFSFSVSSNAINFGSLTQISPRYASSTNVGGDSQDTVAHTLDVATNAASGYIITVQGGTLTSEQNPSNTITAIGSVPITPAAGSEQFGIYATKSGGVNGTIATPYATPSSFGYNATATTSATFASGNSSSIPETYFIHYVANISSVTEAGAYRTNLVYVGTANY